MSKIIVRDKEIAIGKEIEIDREREEKKRNLWLQKIFVQLHVLG